MPPADGTAFGFNKVSDALDISHVQMAKYMEVAREALDRSIIYATRAGDARERSEAFNTLLRATVVGP